MSEEIVARIETEDKVGSLINLIFTSKRAIVAYLIPARDMWLKAAFEGDFRKDIKDKREEYGRVSAESILTAHKKNFAIPYEMITKVEMKRPGTFSGGKIKIFSTDKIYEFTIKEKKVLLEERARLINSVLPTKLSLTQ